MERVPGLGSLTRQQIDFYDTEGYLVLENHLKRFPNLRITQLAAVLVEDTNVAHSVVSHFAGEVRRAVHRCRPCLGRRRLCREDRCR